MSIVKRHLAEHEERLVLIEEICIDKGASIKKQYGAAAGVAP
jgi:hypothetical protein